MRREWEFEDLLAEWSSTQADQELIANKYGATRLGFCLMFKFFEIDARFPRQLGEIPAAAVQFMANQVGVPPQALSDALAGLAQGLKAGTTGGVKIGTRQARCGSASRSWTGSTRRRTSTRSRPKPSTGGASSAPRRAQRGRRPEREPDVPGDEAGRHELAGRLPAGRPGHGHRSGHPRLGPADGVAAEVAVRRGPDRGPR